MGKSLRVLKLAVIRYPNAVLVVVLAFLRSAFAKDGKEMYKKLKRTCSAIVLLIKPFV